MFSSEVEKKLRIFFPVRYNVPFPPPQGNMLGVLFDILPQSQVYQDFLESFL